ncbi:uncharacterized protein LOC108030488 [Drosophila biarmipes]|uniref:uncharacterized protein LOC108030488 n=1 Tax=Drosophila biarmipes TaxID=125945 RepID=UPI0007E62BBB|nr:uncharacterized protein LOC108030488 [Drosophila biarmipes]XP_016958860.1 uncharacterized protein LOC108030488 [Drosophila biarmipes]XP_016958862.1 uncharacterized protein LOC108030488 [Drosophila biarmipes]XP_043948662.1 uncharacterized protein LOC108030488 [Drosophila biarmipes]
MRSINGLWIGLLFATSYSFMSCNGHGRLIEPPSRASAWRFGFPTPPDYNDHELYCGGFTRQWKVNGGKCGECGDAWDVPEPRPHESGGQWGQGLIVRSYLPGSKIKILVELTASHMGYFEFRICPNQSAKQFCFDQNVLLILEGYPSHPIPTDLNIRFYPRNGSRIYEIQAQLPDLTCDQCVLQWRYVAGNNWGICSDGNGAVGCGPQEEFRSCSDIALTNETRTYVKHSRPSYPTPTQPTQMLTTTDTNSVTRHSETLKYTIIIFLVLILIVFTFSVVIWYILNYNKKVCSNKCIISLKNNMFSCNSIKENILGCNLLKTPCRVGDNKLENPPIPPPRTKRLDKVMKIPENSTNKA